MRTVTPLAELRKKTHEAERPRRRWRRWAWALLLLILIGGVVWAVRPDPHFARVQALQKELANAKDLAPEVRKAKFQELREQLKHLNDDQKWELAAPMREKQKAEMDRYFALAPAEKVKYLDNLIDKSEKMRKDWEKKSPGQGKAGGGFTGGGGPPSFSAGSKQARSAEDIEKNRKARLDRTSPEERAHADQFRKEMNDRRKQRGLPVR